MKSQKLNKILVVGDMHLRPNLGYHDYIKGGREGEKKEIFDFIIQQSEDCETVVFLGDQLNAKNNSSSVVNEFVKFIEKFGDKDIYFLVGNHERTAKGTNSANCISALDFIDHEEIRKNWFVAKSIMAVNERFVLCPYFFKSEWGVDNNEAAEQKIMECLKEYSSKTKILFVHHAISDTLTHTGATTEIFNEIVLPKKELEKYFGLIVGGHIHSPQVQGKTIIAGSIFNNEVGETQKYIWKISEKTLEVKQIGLPGRGIYKFEDPKLIELENLQKKNIVKAILTKKVSGSKIEELKQELRRFDAFVLLERYPQTRKKLHYEKGEGILEFNVEKLLELYAKERDIDLKSLLRGFELIK